MRRRVPQQVPRLVIEVLAVLGSVVMSGAIVAAYAARREGTSRGVTGLLVVGIVVCLAGTVLAELEARRPAGLVVPDEHLVTRGATRLPGIEWWAPVLLTGLAALSAGAMASPAVGVVGAVLTAVGLVGLLREVRRPPAVLDRRCVRGARRLQTFGRRHAVGGDCAIDVTLEHVGLGATRVVAVARDGAFGDVVARSLQRAELMAALAGARVHEQHDRAWGAQLRTGDYEWRRMAGLQLAGGQAGR